MRPPLCIVVPVLDEADGLADRLMALRPVRERGARVVVVDGGSRDNTLTIARDHADLAFRAPRGRGAQMRSSDSPSFRRTMAFFQWLVRPASARRLRLSLPS